MPEDQTTSRSGLLTLTGEIVSAHLGNNAVAQADAAPLIQSVSDKLSALAGDEKSTPVELTPAVPIKRSVTGDYLSAWKTGRSLRC